MESSELGSVFAAKRAASRAKRGRNREHGSKRLAELGLAFVAHNSGAHLVVQGCVDYWPGTGLWKDRRTRGEGRGLEKLLRYLKG